MLGLFSGARAKRDVEACTNHGMAMAHEAHRVYRGMVEDYYEERQLSVSVNGEGIFRWALLVSSFMPVAYLMKWEDTKYWSWDDFQYIAQCTSGAALKKKLELGNREMYMPHEEAKKIGTEWGEQIQIWIAKDVAYGPSGGGFYTEHFKSLVSFHHDALELSIGKSNYTQEVREYFDHPITGGMFAGFAELAQFCGLQRRRS